MENHNLTNEFPELAEKINTFKLNDDVFKKMYVNYEEGDQNHTTDEHLTDLRKKRVHLKDDLYSYLMK